MCVRVCQIVKAVRERVMETCGRMCVCVQDKTDGCVGQCLWIGGMTRVCVCVCARLRGLRGGNLWLDFMRARLWWLCVSVRWALTAGIVCVSDCEGCA